jgi:hypothetical protein
VAPAGNQGLTGSAVNSAGSQTHLWGYYDVYIDIPTQTATAVLSRGAQFSANVVQFVNSPVGNLTFDIKGTPTGVGYIDVDIDVGITHPFPGLHQYDGYDVRGIFIGHASKTLKYNFPDLKCAAHNSATDQEMYDYGLTSPDPGIFGNPDGYTRWFNPVEFGTAGLFGYTPGAVATPGYTGNSTLNPYKYYADGLGISGDLWSFLTTSTDSGVFTAGTINKRNYYLRFPGGATEGIKFNYAIVANWIDETTHPANAPEEGTISVSVTPDVFWVSDSDKGGKLKLDMSFPTLWSQVPATVFIDSTVLTNPYQLSTAEMIPIGGGAGYSTWHVEIPADNVTGSSSTVWHEFWVIKQYDSFNYKNDFGVTNLAGEDPLASFFRYALYVSPFSYNKLPICDLVITSPPMPAAKIGGVAVSFDASASYDPDPPDTLTFTWDFNGNGVYGEIPADDYTGDPDKPTHFYAGSYDGLAYVKVTDNKGGFSECSVAIEVTAKDGKNITLLASPAGICAFDIALDDATGDLYTIYTNGSIYKSTLANDYETSALWGTGGWPGANYWQWRLDKNPNGNAVASGFGDINGGAGFSGYFTRNSFGSAGNLLFSQNYYSPTECNFYQYCPDVAAFQAAPFLDCNGMVYTKRDSAAQISVTVERGSPGYAPPYADGSLNRHRLFVPDPMPVNPAYVGKDNVRGTETGRIDTTIWFLQGADWQPTGVPPLPGPVPLTGVYYASRFLISGSGFPGPFAYDFSYIGTGAQVNNNTGFWNPQDITRDNGNKICILDITQSGLPIVKVWDDPDPLVNPTSLGSFGNPTTIDGTPRRIEGSQYNGWIFVLHGDIPTVGTVQFTGTGLNDLCTGPTYQSDGNHTYTVQIDGASTFQWNMDGGAWTTGVGIQGINLRQTLNNAVTVRLATTGHTVGDYWVFTCMAAPPSKVSIFFPSEIP